MALLAVFEIPGGTEDKYREILAGLEAKGLGAPDGRIHHVAAQAPDGWFVVDIYRDEAAMMAFGAGLQPELEKAGWVPKMTVYPVANTIVGA